MVDKSVINSFFLEKPQLQRIDNEQAINWLLENDAKRFGYLCTTIKYMGMQIASESGKLSDGFVCVGDASNGNYYLEIVNDDFDVLAKWLISLENVSAFYSSYDAKTVEKELKKRGINKEVKATPQATYTGEKLQVDLPENIIIRKLSYEDKKHILTWANGKKDGYISHLLSEKDYKDENTLEFGIFEGKEMIAVAGCGIDCVHGYELNNCCNIRFAENLERNDLYRPIFEYITNYILDWGVIPFDDLQHGDYAIKHGGFTSTEIGFKTVNWRYDIL